MRFEGVVECGACGAGIVQAMCEAVPSSAASRSNDAIDAILRAPNHFECLGLSEPTLDLLGRPVWEVSVDEISKAYRKLARFCHPDKLNGMSDDEAKRAEQAYETLRLAKDCLSKEDLRGPYVREHCQFIKPDTSALEIKSDDLTASVERVKAVEKEQRKEMKSMRSSESQELGSTVAQEMEKKRKIAELKRIQARAKAAEKASTVSSDDSDAEDAKLRAKAPMVVKKVDEDEDGEEEARKKRQRQAAQRRRGGRMGV